MRLFSFASVLALLGVQVAVRSAHFYAHGHMCRKNVIVNQPLSLIVQICITLDCNIYNLVELRHIWSNTAYYHALNPNPPVQEILLCPLHLKQPGKLSHTF
jgi:hypothetical protein